MVEMGMGWHRGARRVLFWPVIIVHRADRLHVVYKIARLNIHLQIVSLGLLDYGFVIKNLNGF